MRLRRGGGAGTPPYDYLTESDARGGEAAPAGGGVARPAGAELVRPGQLIAGRYRLEELRGAGPGSQVWRAMDELLARQVAVRIVPAGEPDADSGAGVVKAAVRAAAVAAGAVSDGRLVRILDCDTTGEGAGRFLFLVLEWVAAPTLAALLAEEPLPPGEATDVVWQVTDTLARAARLGVRHARLHPGNVALGATGEVRVMDLAVAGALRCAPGDVAPATGADVAAVGALLYAALTGYWPGATDVGLPRAPTARGRRCTARQVRAAVSRELDELTERLLSAAPGVDTLDRAADALAAQPRQRREADTTVLEPVGGGRRGQPGRWAVRLVPVAALAVIAAVGYLVGGVLSQVPAPTRTAPTFRPAQHVVGHAVPHQLPIAGVSVFNPQGQSPEDVGGAGYAVDGQLATAWYTFHYYGNPVFGGLKPGVGLLFDLGRVRTLRTVHLALVYPGASVSLLTSDSAGSALSDYNQIASVADAAQLSTFSPAHPVQARYLLVWLTRLPWVGSYYNEGVSEVAVFG